MPYRQSEAPAPIVFVAHRVKFIALGLLLIGIVVGLGAMAVKTDDKGLLYFIVLPFGTFAVAASLFFIVRPATRITLDGDSLQIRQRRFPLVEVVISEVERRQAGRVSRLCFDISAADPDGKMVNFEITATGWPNFREMHQVLSKATRRSDAHA